MKKSIRKNPDKAFEDLAILAVRAMDMPFAGITLRDNDGPFVKTCIGIEAHEASEIHTLGDQLIEKGKDILLVEDARKDKRYNSLGCVTGAPQLVFYAGVALTNADGSVAGTLAVMDRMPRQLNSNQIETFKLLAQQVVQLLELRKTQNALSQKSPFQTDAERLRNIVESSRIATWEWNVQTGEVRINERWAEIIGYTKDELAPINIDMWYKVVHPEDRERTDRELQACFRKEQEYYDTECRLLHKDGHEIWINDRGRVVEWTEDGEPLWMMGTHTDITEQKNNEKQLLTISDNIPGTVFRYRLRPDGEDSLEIVSKGAYELWGVSPDEAMHDNATVWRNFDKNDLQDVRESIRTSARELSHWQCEWRYHHPDGTIRWHRGSGNPSRTEHGNTIWDSLILDITEQKKAKIERDSYLNAMEERIKEQTVLYRIAQLSNEQIPVHTMLQKAVELIPAGWQYPEITQATICYGKSKFKTKHFKKTKWSQSVHRVTASGEKLEVIVAYSQKMPVEDDGPFLKEEWHLINNIADNLTIRLNHLTAIEHNELILQSTDEGIYGIDDKGVCTFINNAAAKMLSYTPDECLGQNMHELIHHHTESGEPYSEADCPIYKSRKNVGGCRVNNEVFWTRQQKAIPVRYSSTPILADGKYKGAVIVFNDISETKKAENELQLREKRFRSLVENGADAIAIIGPDGKASYVSPSITRVLGYTEEESLKMNLFEIIHPDDLPKGVARIEEALKNPGVPIKGYTSRTKHKDGSWRWLEATINNLLHDPAVNGIVDNFRDVTERVEFEQSLMASEEKYRSLFDNSPLPKWIYDLNTGGILDVNQTAIEKYGYSKEEFLNLHITELRPESEIPALMEAMNSVKISEGTSQFGVFTHITKNGKLMRMEASGHRLKFDNKDSLMVVCNDVTEREAAFEALQASEARYRGFYESQTNYVLRTDMAGNYTYVNKKFAADFGWMYSDGEIIGENSLSSILERDHEKVGKVVESCVESPGKVFKVEINKPAPDGGYVTTLWEFVCILNERSEPDEIQCVGLDITDRINTERALLESHERFEKVTQATNDAIWDFDVVKNELFWGQGFDNLFGYNPQNTTPTFELLIAKIHPEDRDRVATKVASYMQDDSATNWHEEYRFIKADGTFAHVIDRAVFIRDKQSKVTRVVGAMTDITYRKEHEESLKNLNEQLKKHARDLEISNAELEQFAYIASHDLQEPLRMVSSFLNQLERKYQNQLDEKAQQYIYFAVDGAKRMRQIILDLLEFSRVGRLEESKATIDLNEIIEGYCALRKKVIEEKSAVIRYKKLPKITTFKTAVIQIFHNLIDNGLKYSRAGIAPEIKINAQEKGQYWEFSVCDNGIGIDEEYFDKIFVIFQRLHTNSEYSGTGMGLAIVKKIVENMGGDIWLESEHGKGSCFHFTLPKKDSF